MMTTQRDKRIATQAHMDAIAAGCGPMYGARLIDTLPIPGSGMRQQMPNRSDLERAKEVSERTVAGYEVLLSHYLDFKNTIEARERSWQDGHSVQELRHKTEVDQLQQQIAQLKKTVAAGDTAISQLEQAVSHKNDCAKCGGTGQERRSWNNDYIDCSACNGKGR